MNRVLILPAVGLLITFSAPAQSATPDSVSEPEFAGVVFQLDAGRLIHLERQAVAKTSTKASGFMVVHAKSVWEFTGAKSPVRFRSGVLEFVVRSPGTQLDPALMYHLRKLDSKKKTREMVFATARATPFGATASTNQASEGELPLTFARYAEASTKITATGLPPGEYAVQVSPYQTAFCFGVD